MRQDAASTHALEAAVLMHPALSLTIGQSAIAGTITAATLASAATRVSRNPPDYNSKSKLCTFHDFL